MELEERIITGHVTTVIDSLKEIVTELQAYNFIKIGQTVNFNNRIKRHAASKKHKWKKMVVLYSSSSHYAISYAEKVLIAHLKNEHPRSAVNIAPGGEGINNPSNYRRFYIYALVKSKRSC